MPSIPPRPSRRRGPMTVVAVSVLDEGAASVSSVYAFWDPDFARFAPGTFSALWELEWARARGKHYYYLGYWVSGCAKMRYKASFRPYELFDWDSGVWKRQAAPPRNDLQSTRRRPDRSSARLQQQRSSSCAKRSLSVLSR